MKALLLVRHGATAWNAEGRLQGQADIALSAEGREQVAALAPLITELRPARVACSDLLRARETAALLGYAAPALDPRLREADLGDWTGRRSADLRATAGDLYHDWRVGRVTPPNAEPWAALCARVDAALSELQAGDGITLVVTHGGVVRAACALLIGLQPAVIQPPAPASLTAITLDGRPRLAVFNRTGDRSPLSAPD